MGQQHTIASARVRDNQRRSRARRKEYIQDLEERLRKYEQQGSQASAEVQAAARRVTRENYMLRSLLALHGVSEHDIQDFVRQETDVAQATPPTTNKRTSKAPNAPSSKHAPASRRSLFHPDTDQTPVNQSDWNPVSISKTKSECSDTFARLAGPSVGQGEPLDLNETSVMTITAGAIPQPRNQDFHLPTLAADDTTSCEKAAGIIASMRGQVDLEEARVELGCSNGASCMVKNTTIFQMMDP